MNAVTARAVCHYFRAQFRCEAVIAVLITTHPFPCDSEFLREGYTFVTLGASFGADSRCNCAVCSNRWIDIVNPMTISAHRRSRHATHYCLSMNALHELRTLALVTLAAREGNVDFGDGRLWIGGRKDVVAVMTIGTNSRAQITLRDGFCVHTFSIRKKGTLTDAAALHH